MEPVSKCGWYTQGFSTDGKLSLCQWVLTVASCIGMGHSIYFPILLESVNIVTVSLCPYVYLSCCIKMTLLSWTHPFSGTFTFCLSLHHHRPLNLKVVVGNEHSEVSHSLHIVHSWVSVLIAIYCKKEHSMMWIEQDTDTWVYQYVIKRHFIAIYL